MEIWPPPLPMTKASRSAPASRISPYRGIVGFWHGIEGRVEWVFDMTRSAPWSETQCGQNTDPWFTLSLHQGRVLASESLRQVLSHVIIAGVFREQPYCGPEKWKVTEPTLMAFRKP